MAALNSKTIKNKIKSVKNTRKITKTMEMIAATKMRKSVEAVTNTRLYAKIASDLLAKVSNVKVELYPLLKKREVKKVLIVLVTSNRGLCGSFNSNVLKLSDAFYKENFSKNTDIQVDVLGIGKKSAAFAKRNALNLIALFDNFSDTPNYEDARIITGMLVEKYLNNEYDQVNVVYTDFLSSMLQKANVRKILPLSSEILGEGTDTESKDVDEYSENQVEIDSYLFEPNPKTVVNYVVPKLLEVQVFQTLLESSASEHSARMVAMKSASDAAGDMIQALTLEYNKARQAAITKEIAEISNGAEALNG